MEGRVAIVTGGASGIGLAVAQSILAKGFVVHTIDKDNTNRDAIASKNPSIIQHTADITSWESLSSAFDAVFKSHGRLDFVFANAGVCERSDFFAKPKYLRERCPISSDSKGSETGSDDLLTLAPPPPLDESSLDTNIKGTTYTSYLAQYYFRASPGGGGDRVLIMTSSIAGIYAQELAPIYSTTKGAILTLARAIAGPLREEGIRTYAICPGIVRTSFVAEELWDAYPEEHITPMSRVTETVDMLIAGGRMQDSRGSVADEAENHGLVVEIFGEEIFFRERHIGWSDGLRYALNLVEKSKNEYGSYLRSNL